MWALVSAGDSGSNPRDESEGDQDIYLYIYIFILHARPQGSADIVFYSDFTYVRVGLSVCWRFGVQS